MNYLVAVGVYSSYISGMYKLVDNIIESNIARTRAQIKIRKSWGSFSPITRKVESKKVYKRREKFLQSVSV